MKKAFDIVIFGGTGDLSLRKLIPAMYRSEMADLLHEDVRIFLTSRGQDLGESTFALIKEWLDKAMKSNESADTHWDKFKQRLHLTCLDIGTNDERWSQLGATLDQATEGDRIYYMAIPPKLYGPTCELLHVNGMIVENSRVVLEKPIGYNRNSANDVNAQVGKYFPESAIFRIDHYLGKETVQNLLALRFANTLFEPLWSCQTIDHVQISIAESVGLEGRTGFYDQAGAMRDMVQNHLIQLLCLVAMEPPHQLASSNIRTEKLKVLEALRPIQGADALTHTVRGQYEAGISEGKPVAGYLDELGKEDSETETFVAIKAHIDNWRWASVPFYLRTGKRLRSRCAEIVIQFKGLIHSAFDKSVGNLQSNRLVIRLQPDEGIQLTLMAKELNEFDMRLKAVPLNLNFADTFENFRSDSYQRLILNVVNNDLSLFTHRDEVDLAWSWIDPILSAWDEMDAPLQPYDAGSWGPDSAAALLHTDKRAWVNDSRYKKGGR